MAHILKVKVTLNLSTQPVAVKILKGRHYVTSMTGNANFTTPSPTLASVTTANKNITLIYLAKKQFIEAKKYYLISKQLGVDINIPFLDTLKIEIPR